MVAVLREEGYWRGLRRPIRRKHVHCGSAECGSAPDGGYGFPRRTGGLQGLLVCEAKNCGRERRGEGVYWNIRKVLP